jgi:TRAP-type C4-dicarboxylate transport system permease large subunit
MVMHGMVRTLKLKSIYVATMPYLAADFLRLALLVAVPAIATWLPGLMKAG